MGGMVLAPRWRKVVRDVWSNKTRTFLVVLSIAVGVFAVGTVQGSRAMIDEELRADYAATNPSHARVFTTPVDDAFITAVRRMDGVRDAEGVFTFGARVKLGPADSEDATAQWRDITIEVRNDFERLRVNQLYPDRGAYPPPRRQMLVERAAFGTFGVPLGGAVRVETPDGKEHDIPIAGLVHDLDKPSPVFSTRLYGYATFDTQEWLGFRRGYNQVAFTASEGADDEAHLRSLVDRISDRIERSGARPTGSRIRLQHPAIDQVQAMILILTVLGSLSLFLACFLVVNTMLATLTQQIRQIGVMKTIGARTTQVTQLYLASVAAFGFLSLFIALPLGAAGAFGLSLYAAGMLNYDVHFSLAPEVLAAEVGVGLVVPVAAALAPVLAGARVTVREAISTYGLGNAGEGRFGLRLPRAAGALLSRFASRPLLLALRNTFRRKMRLSLTLFTLTLAGAMFIGVMNVQASLTAVTDEAFRYWNYDVSLGFQQLQAADKVVAEARAIPVVREAEMWQFDSSIRIRPDGTESRSYPVIAAPPESTFIEVAVTQGRWLRPDDTAAVVVTASTLRDDPDIRVGEDVTLKIKGKPSVWRVVGVVRTVGDQGRFYAPYAHFAQVTHVSGRGNSLQLTTGDVGPAAQSARAEQLKEHFDKLGMRVGSTTAVAVNRSNVSSQINVLVVFMMLMAVLLAVVGGLGLMGTMSINVVERQREIGVMRAIGASTPALMRVFIVEAVIIGVISWVIGAALSVPIGKVMSDGVGQAILQAPLVYTIAPLGLAAWLGLIVVIAGLAALLPALRAARITVREVLAYE